MVISGIGIHETQDMIARAFTSSGVTWVDLSSTGTGSNVAIYLYGDDAFARAQRMADAINAALSGNPVTQEELA